MKPVQRPGRPAPMLRTLPLLPLFPLFPLFPLLPLLRRLPTVWLMVTLGCNTALAQTRVDRTLSVQPTGTPAFINDLPASASTPSVPQQRDYQAPAATNQISRHTPSGSYSSEAMGAAILAKNADVETTFKINLPIPPGSTISNVSWRYGLSSKPVGFEAVLCWNNQQRCWNVTNTASGNTLAFNGKDATRPFTLHYRVKGSGQLGPPAQGEMNQVIVTYDLPG